VLREIIDLSLLSYKDKDDLVDIFKSYDSKLDYDIEKYRDDRLRYMYKDRYDVRENLIDWDYSMKMRNFVIILNKIFYIFYIFIGSCC
jgi:dynein assembly factor 3